MQPVKGLWTVEKRLGGWKEVQSEFFDDKVGAGPGLGLATGQLAMFSYIFGKQETVHAWAFMYCWHRCDAGRLLRDTARRWCPQACRPHGLPIVSSARPVKCSLARHRTKGRYNFQVKGDITSSASSSDLNWCKVGM